MITELVLIYLIPMYILKKIILKLFNLIKNLKNQNLSNKKPNSLRF